MVQPSPMTLKRINREISDLRKENMGGMTLTPTEESLFTWRGSIPGPEGSVYEGGLFWMEITLPQDYPFSAPKVHFITRIYHMNISERGNVCIDMLKNNWSPALSLYKVLLSLSSLLTDPNPKDPLVPQIANEYVKNRAQHNKTARHWTQLYALPPAVKAPITAPSNSAASSKGLHDEIIVIDDDGLPASGRGARRKRDVEQEDGRRKRPRGDASGGSAGPSSGGTSLADVIVIDD